MVPRSSLREGKKKNTNDKSAPTCQTKGQSIFSSLSWKEQPAVSGVRKVKRAPLKLSAVKSKATKPVCVMAATRQLQSTPCHQTPQLQAYVSTGLDSLSVVRLKTRWQKIPACGAATGPRHLCKSPRSVGTQPHPNS